MTSVISEQLAAEALIIALYRFKQTQPSDHTEWHELQRTLERTYEVVATELID